MTAVIATVLGLIETYLLPLVASSADTALITSIISTLEGLLPLIVGSIGPFYSSVKGIIAALQQDPSTLPDQLAALQALDKQADDAFEAVAIDTDNESTTATEGTIGGSGP